MRRERYQRLDFSDLNLILENLCAHIQKTDLLKNKNRKVLTFGSCFAANLAASLRMRGYSSRSVELVEWINTPATNLAVLERALNREQSDIFLPEGSTLDDGVNQLGILVREADCVIVTVGIGYIWKKLSDGATVAVPEVKKLDQYATEFQSTASLKSSLKNLIYILDQENKSAKKFLTLSPIPLEFSTVYDNAIVSDCVSKSLLRSAIHELTQEIPTMFTYFPAYEFFRWVSGHCQRSFYGADGKTRHVDDDLVDLLIQKFIDLNSVS